MRPEHGDLTIHGKLSYDEIVDPINWNEGADADQIVKNAELIAHRFPVMEHGLAMGGYSGLYDATPDHHPVLGAHTRVTPASTPTSAGGGHGTKPLALHLRPT
jgi:glycine/D-amino acid oxidase-like deaminating enzyme